MEGKRNERRTISANERAFQLRGHRPAAVAAIDKRLKLNNPSRNVYFKGRAACVIIAISKSFRNCNLSLFIYFNLKHSPSKIKKCANRGPRTEKMLPSNVTTQTPLPTTRLEKRENTFCQKYFPVVGEKICSLCGGYIIPLLEVFVNL